MALPLAWNQNGGDYFIPHRVLLLARKIERETARDLQSAFNISVAEWRVLSITCTRGSSSAAEICAVFETDRAEVSRAVSRLLKADLIQREPDDSHRQKMRIIATPAGRVVFDGVVATRDAYFSYIMQDMTQEERHNFNRALEGIAIRVDERRSTRIRTAGAPRSRRSKD
ncbi:MarR family transcriptional regulator [Sphingobium sp. H33]|uniref:MarR family transcriptional regulator n=1 Tax=Sphingobium nicotianae TaxID=2782607 RepID=A0A9X1D9Z7_9SPHN|nr:MarR family transcriptional regulator [Sphingobium nicotianae]